MQVKSIMTKEYKQKITKELDTASETVQDNKVEGVLKKY